MDIFQSMVKSTSLLSSEIHKIKENWTGQRELQYANYALGTLPKGLKFFHPVSPSESPKVMGLTGIHHPNTLCCFTGVTHGLCGKEGQNEGTIINHLRMVHYQLGLVCKKCFCCPSVTSEAIWHHGQKSWQHSMEGGADKSSSSLNCLSVPMSQDSWGFPYEVQAWDTLHVQGMPTALNTWTHMEDQMKDLMSTNPPCAFYLYLLASHLDSRHENDRGLDIHQTDACTSSRSSCILLRPQSGNVFFTDWPFYSGSNGAVTAIQEFDASLHTPLWLLSKAACQSLNPSCMKP